MCNLFDTLVIYDFCHCQYESFVPWNEDIRDNIASNIISHSLRFHTIPSSSFGRFVDWLRLDRENFMKSSAGHDAVRIPKATSRVVIRKIGFHRRS